MVAGSGMVSIYRILNIPSGIGREIVDFHWARSLGACRLEVLKARIEDKFDCQHLVLRIDLDPRRGSY